MVDHVELVGGGSHVPCLVAAVEEGFRPFVVVSGPVGCVWRLLSSVYDTSSTHLPVVIRMPSLPGLDESVHRITPLTFITQLPNQTIHTRIYRNSPAPYIRRTLNAAEAVARGCALVAALHSEVKVKGYMYVCMEV